MTEVRNTTQVEPPSRAEDSLHFPPVAIFIAHFLQATAWPQEFVSNSIGASGVARVFCTAARAFMAVPLAHAA